MIIEAAEAFFGSTDERAITVEFLSEDGSAFRTIEAHALAHELGIKPVHTPVNSPRTNGMAKSFVNTFKRDYVGCIERSSGAAVLVQLPDTQAPVLSQARMPFKSYISRNESSSLFTECWMPSKPKWRANSKDGYVRFGRRQSLR